jgi:hypothetical protein
MRLLLLYLSFVTNRRPALPLSGIRLSVSVFERDQPVSFRRHATQRVRPACTTAAVVRMDVLLLQIAGWSYRMKSAHGTTG